MIQRPIACDIFCTVIDNFGDIGVAWRLARQLAAEHGWSVRLWVDDLQTFAKLAPSLQPDKRWQHLGEIVVEHWREPFIENEPLTIADVVIEAFACDLPPVYLAAMAERTPAPVWINLDYLSSEDWVGDFHLKPSPHPRLPLNKWFFFPGLGAQTGGVLIEQAIQDRRDAFQRDPAARAALFERLGVPPPGEAATVVSLFAYENPATAELLGAWRDGDAELLALVPVGRIGPDVARFLGLDAFDTTVRATRGKLTVQALPFVDHETYDRILWTCDLNFVRGEDSFVRAQLAARPFVWHIYPQHDDAHLPKLDAALAHITAHLDAGAAQALTQVWQRWNGAPDDTHAGPEAIAHAWAAWTRHRETLARGAREWIEELATRRDLAGNLAEFAESRLK
ncbi:elongation factor P maturation arginine rhamnosyltransferase EarP [Pararobbsia silviterrae]|uniref:Protein-arginine rhamnosyltransferase n=1 Tax=Pararobbsia silviterrae TaxID=1792498 RepID=A0A494Y955_9BURK|nr:elongation factor P maturation arginine rhamnosyltransferase EarP [Pararobbsia silviterrae]RKP56440.1 elongation factor P maturation arginine rhamnosyltransferase EarP [Pararobbsia silviterrae]